jgi:protein-disulfide isomerase
MHIPQVALPLILVCTAGIAEGQTPSTPDRCSTAPLTESKKQQLVQYLTKKYKLQNYGSVKIVKEHVDPRNCYRELTFEGASAVKTWELTMFLSPDQRFLSSEVFDTTLNPDAQEQRQNEELMAGSDQTKAVARGPANAPVTIVEFADFQCPFCRKLSDMLELLVQTGTVRVVFHHMPLSTHTWARAAAIAAGCAQLQGPTSFWALHDQIFLHQQEIEAENVEQELLHLAQTSGHVNVPAFQSCIAGQESLGLVLRDLDLAAAYNVTAVPTLFLNGLRVVGVKDSNQLAALVNEARKQPPGVPR